MKKTQTFSILTLLIIGTLTLLAFQNKEKEQQLTDEQRIEQALQKKIKAFHQEEQRKCQQKAMREAIPIVDSLIAENYAKDLRAKDFILKRPDKPEMPEVEIKPFPLDSVE
jgi:hypothetical protein